MSAITLKTQQFTLSTAPNQEQLQLTDQISPAAPPQTVPSLQGAYHLLEFFRFVII
ncbi:hypothetical protein [Nostoc sp. ChiQUE01b]|uniref:hypothetical protein n=1 Tax=Nostoc sp. ChiQUE01b TaxID=3075376 RepID=UPI002AD3ED8B|nr:hypothetical protein [Nostoc sp. ChiQUE01b]MDZ8259881.1 hypothetical protein [Nostoc sp. ChiQUE01b]